MDALPEEEVTGPRRHSSSAAELPGLVLEQARTGFTGVPGVMPAIARAQ